MSLEKSIFYKTVSYLFLVDVKKIVLVGISFYIGILHLITFGLVGILDMGPSFGVCNDFYEHASRI